MSEFYRVFIDEQILDYVKEKKKWKKSYQILKYFFLTIQGIIISWS